MNAIGYSFSIESFNNIWPKNQCCKSRVVLMERRHVHTLKLMNRTSIFIPIIFITQALERSGDIVIQHNRTTFKIVLIDELLEAITVTV